MPVVLCSSYPAASRRIVVVVALLLSAAAGRSWGQSKSPQLPRTKTIRQVDDYHGTQVEDPYRWLEDTDSPETLAWITEQNKVTSAWLAQIPAREPIRRRVEKLWNYARYGVPHRKGGTYFYEKNDGLQSQSVLYSTQDLADPQASVLLDPNTLRCGPMP